MAVKNVGGANGWVALGDCSPRAPGRSGRADFPHPAPQVTGFAEGR
jgi:hypothetical protein